MTQFIDAPCPVLTERGKTLNDGRLLGTRWLYNPQLKRWYLVKLCPECKQIHKPANVRDDRLVIPPLAT